MLYNRIVLCRPIKGYGSIDAYNSAMNLIVPGTRCMQLKNGLIESMEFHGELNVNCFGSFSKQLQWIVQPSIQSPFLKIISSC